MITLLFTIMIITGILFIGSVLLMTPKGGLGFGVGGMATSNEYGSKKSVEGTLKKTALISIVLFVLAAILYPYAAKKELSTGVKMANPAQTQNNIKLSPQDIKIETKDSKAIEIKTENTQTTQENK